MGGGHRGCAFVLPLPLPPPPQPRPTPAGAFAGRPPAPAAAAAAAWWVRGELAALPPPPPPLGRRRGGDSAVVTAAAAAAPVPAPAATAAAAVASVSTAAVPVTRDAATARAAAGPSCKRIMVLMSDTGGGHRASAEALVAAFHEAYPDRVSTWVVDLFTDIAGPPFGRLPSQYAFLAARPPLWRAVWEYGRFPPTRAATEAFTTAVSGGAVTDAIRAYAPDLILSVHPLCQTLVLHALERLEPRRRRGRLPRPPFVTVVTDLGGAHPTWFDPAVDRLFVPSDAVAAIAARCGVSAVKTRQLGLPVRSPFWGPPAANGDPAASPAVNGAPAAAPAAGVSALGAGVGGGTTASGNGTIVAPPRPPVRRAVSDTYYALDGPGKQSAQPLLASPAKRATRLALGLHPDVPTVLVVGGGDGVGGLAAIVPALTAALGASSAAAAADGAAPVAQVVVVCGKNEAVRRRVAAAPAVPRVSLTVTGFVTNMADWMGAADCLVTKAGPGTIAEALICGLPMVLSAYLPGQEAPNVPFVVEGGVGVYRQRPREIAAIVAAWFADPAKLERMSARAQALGRANASRDIARSIGEMIPW